MPQLPAQRTKTSREGNGSHPPLIKPNLNNGAQGWIRTSVARKERQIYSLLPLTTRPPVRNSAAHFAFNHSAPTNKNSQAHSNALHSPLGKFPATVVPRLPCARAATLSSPTGEIWSWRRDLNPRPSDYKSDALPAELRQLSGRPRGPPCHPKTGASDFRANTLLLRAYHGTGLKVSTRD